jgi:hypothetical protein
MSRIIPFARASIAPYLDIAGILQQAPINVRREAHYVNGQRTSLIEDRGINFALYSNDLANAGGWIAFDGAAGTVAKDAVGLDGNPGTATTLTDNDAAGQYGRTQLWTLTNPKDNSVYVASAWFRKDGVSARCPELGLTALGGVAQNNKVDMRTDTGAYLQRSAIGVHPYGVINTLLWWVLWVALRNNSSNNNQLKLDLHPARASALGVAGNTPTGSAVVGQVQLEQFALKTGRNPVYGPTSPIITTNAIGIREADFEQRVTNTIEAIDLRRDNVTGVFFDANDPAQLAAHPDNRAQTVTRGDTTIRDGYAIKNATPIAGRIVRPDNDSSKSGQKP